MFVSLILTSLLIGTYEKEDFHYYDENLNVVGLPMVNKIYVNISGITRKQFINHTGTLKDLNHLKEIETDDLSGVLLFFNNKEITLKTLNELQKYKAKPIVVFNNIECVVTNKIVVKLKPSANKDDFIKRLHSVAKGEFDVKEVKYKLLLVDVKILENPSNILILSNLIANDIFWIEHASLALTPLDGYVKATAYVETGAITSLGETRALKIIIDTFDSGVNVRIDLLPQLGQTLVPFPNSGEIWFDSYQPVITETKKANGKRIVVDFPFRQIMYGNFIFQPILISYEKDGKLQTTKTNICNYSVCSIIGNDINDIQARGESGLDITVTEPTKLDIESNVALYRNARVFIGYACLVLFLVNILYFLISWFLALWSQEESDIDKLWSSLRDCKNLPILANWRDGYITISHRLNDVLVGVFGKSLYSVNMDECTGDLRMIILELNKIYKQDCTTLDLDIAMLLERLKFFCFRKA